jgi:hypothetical protein
MKDSPNNRQGKENLIFFRETLIESKNFTFFIRVFFTIDLKKIESQLPTEKAKKLLDLQKIQHYVYSFFEIQTSNIY